MQLNFSDEKYKNIILNSNDNHSIIDAFFLLLKDVEAKNLDNLCNLIKNYMKIIIPNIDLSLEECYELTQGKSIEGKISLDNNMKRVIYSLAYYCIENRNTLGTATINDGKINTSEWLGHSLFEAKLCGQLASACGLDKEKAIKLGMLHDYGRKQINNLTHVTKGYEMLYDEGWYNEAIGCLTHSFLNGGRCASNEKADPGFYVDEYGNPKWEENSYKDDVTIFLENYKYSDYDKILNIADLMATSYRIVSPLERINDIATRREIDPTNRGYFLAELINQLTHLMSQMNINIPESFLEEVKADKNTSIQEIQNKFEVISNIFYTEYQNMFLEEKEQINKIRY